MAPTRPLNAAVKAEVAADHNGLAYTRIAQHNGAAHVFTANLPDLEAWWFALGGYITPEPAGAHAVMWTLTTDTDRGHGAPVTVLAPGLHTDEIDPAIAHAVRPHTA